MMSSTVVFCLDARIQLTPEEAENIRKYRLADTVIYNSEASKKHLDKGMGHLMKGNMVGLARAGVSLAMANLGLNITINKLTQGCHIECKDLNELLGAEEAVLQACQTTKAFLDTAATFEGRETVIDFDAVPELQAVA